MNKTLFVGDIHTKEYIIKKVDELLQKDKEITKVVFVGDYVDEWNCRAEDNSSILIDLFNFKKKYGNLVHLLLGNHEHSYLGYPCSGYKYSTEVPKFLEWKRKDFDVIYKTDNYIVSHAGITTAWISKVADYYEMSEDNLDEIIDRINTGFHEGNTATSELLNLASFTSGGYSPIASCLWSRPDDHKWFPLNGYTQVVGHTPIKDPILESKIDKEGSVIYYIDTFSKFRDGITDIGKGDLLLFDEDKKEFSTLYLYKR